MDHDLCFGPRDAKGTPSGRSCREGSVLPQPPCRRSVSSIRVFSFMDESREAFFRARLLMPADPLRTMLDETRTKLLELRAMKREEQEKYYALVKQRQEATAPGQELYEEKDSLTKVMSDHVTKVSQACWAVSESADGREESSARCSCSCGTVVGVVWGAVCLS